MQVISVMNYKGGVGKTTVTANLGAELARRGKRVLLIDMDPQSSLTFCFFTPAVYQTKIVPSRTIRHWYDSFEVGIPRKSLTEVIVCPPEVNHIVQPEGGRLDLVASDIAMLSLDLDIAKLVVGANADREIFRRRRALADALREVAFSAYDYVLIDCPPGFGLLAQAAMVASDHVLMPTKADYLSTAGLDLLHGAIESFLTIYNAQASRYAGRHSSSPLELDDRWVIYTMVEFMHQRPIATNQFFITQVEKNVGLRAFTSMIRQNVTLFGHSTAHSMPAILKVRTNNQIYVELMALATEFMERFPSRESRVVAA